MFDSMESMNSNIWRQLEIQRESMLAAAQNERGDITRMLYENQQIQNTQQDKNKKLLLLIKP